MPFIQIEAGTVTEEQKGKLINGFTQVASEILGYPKENFLVLIKENDLDNWGVGGKMLSKILKENAK